MKTGLLSTGIRWLWLAFLIFCIDIGSKMWVMESLVLYRPVNLLPFFNFTYVHNTGAAFSIFEGQRWLLSATAILICTILTVMLYRNNKNQWLLNISYCLIIGGALGNLFDRLNHGYVIDFLHFYITYLKIPFINVTIENWHYPVFNFADVAICIGAVLIIIDAIKVSRKGHPSESAVSANDKD